MSTTQLAIETRRLQSDIDSLTAHLDGMRRTGEKMMAGINGLGSMWEGEAKNTFTEQFQSDYETLQSMSGVINDLIKSLEYAREQYDKCENNVASVVDAIRI